MANELGFLELARASMPIKPDVRALRRALPDADAVASVVAALCDEREFDAAAAVIVAAAESDAAADAQALARVIPVVDRIDLLQPCVRAVTGDVDAALFDVLAAGHASSERDALLLLLLARRGADPDRLASEIRRISRRPLGFEARASLGAAAAILDDPDVNELTTVHRQLAGRFDFDGMLAAEGDPIEQLQDHAPRSAVRGVTVERAGEKVGRNDPCPCGSGKKYKKCCLRKPGGVTRQPTVSAVRLTPRKVYDMRPERVRDLDYEELSVDCLGAGFNNFLRYERLDDAVEVLEVIRAKGGDDADGHLEDLLFHASEAGRLDLLRRFGSDDSSDDSIGRRLIGVQLELEALDGQLAMLDELAADALTDPHLEVEFGHTALRSLPHLGVYLARGAITPERPLDAEYLSEAILERRDELGLSPHDPAEFMVDAITNYVLRPLRLAKQARRTATPKSVRADDLLEERDRLEEESARLRRELAEAEDQLQRTRKSQQKRTAASEESAKPESDVADVRRLRLKVEELKGLIDEGRAERSALRTQIAELAEEARERSDDDDEVGTEEPGDDIEPDTVRARVSLPRYHDLFEEALGTLSVDDRFAAMTEVARLSSLPPSRWSGVKKMRVGEDLFTARLSRDVRLLFRLVDGHLEALDVVPRRDLDSALRRWANRD